jgi:uncharacterized protein (DUF342 family)
VSSPSTEAKEVIVEGETREEALKTGARQLDQSPEDLTFFVIEEGSDGFMGFFQRPWKLKVRLRENRSSLKEATIEEAMKAAESVDGSFNIDVDNRKIYLTIHPPEGTGQSVQAEQIIGHLNQVGLSFCDFDKVRSVVNEETGEPVKIGRLPPDEDIDTDYEIKISDDGLEAELVMESPRLGGDPPSVEEVQRIINELGISEGVDWDTIEEMVEERRYNEPTVIAQGRAPKQGEDAKIQYHFDVDNKPNFEDQDGKIDFREMGLINNVDENDLLAEKIEATPGRKGMTVQGEPLEAPEGDDVELQPGENVRLDDNKLIAEISGQVTKDEDGVVSVFDVYTVEGNVDYSTGNIAFDGTVIVEGSVRDRFKVQATGDIIVEEGVEKAYLQSEQNVLIQAGIRGKGHAQINAGGSVMVDFVEQAGLIAQKNVVVSEMIMHSRVDAGEGVYVTGQRGLIAGGEIRAGREVFAKEIGSIGASETRIEVGIDPKFFRSIAKIDTKIVEQREKLDKVQRAIQTMESKEKLDDQEQQKYDKLRETEKNLERNIENFREEQDNLSRRASDREGAAVMVEDVAYSGTRISIDNEIYRIRSGQKQHCGFKKINNSIQQVTFEKPAIPSI